jgi:hypothetical protein
MMKFLEKYSKWIAVLGSALLILSCFLPWAYYPDLDKVFTGFFSEKNIYGRPGKWLTVMAILSLLCHFLPQVFYKRLNLLLMALNLAYAVKSYIIYAACYHGYCPEKRTGIYLMLLSSILLMIATVLPSGKVRTIVEDTPAPVSE